MATRIRLKRMGARHRPFYRIVVADSRAPRDGRFIETLGSYNPVEKPVVIKIKEARIIDWIQKGAQVSTSVSNLLKRTRTLEKIHLIKSGQNPKIEAELAVEMQDKVKAKKKAAKAEEAAPAVEAAAEAPAEEPKAEEAKAEEAKAEEPKAEEPKAEEAEAEEAKAEEAKAE